MAKKTKKKTSAKAAETTKRCFVIAPIGSGSSETRRRTDGLVEAVIEPLLEDREFETKIAHKISATGSIIGQVVECLLNDDLVIADATKLNANVMYELGVRHATGKATIIIAENGTDLPFDILPERTIFYEDDMKGVLDLREQLERALDATSLEELNDNPVTRVSEMSVLREAAHGNDLAKLIVDQFDRFQSFMVDHQSVKRTERLPRGADLTSRLTDEEHVELKIRLMSSRFRDIIRSFSRSDGASRISTSPITDDQYARLMEYVRQETRNVRVP